MINEYRVWVKFASGEIVYGEWSNQISSVFDSVARSLRGAEIGTQKRVKKSS